VQLLDLGKYANGQLIYHHKDHYKEVLDEMDKRGDKRVMVHPNLWDPGFGIFIYIFFIYIYFIFFII
jgi:hypothetical protein